MQLRYLLFITVALLGLGFFACEQENFDETMEEVLPTDTTTIIQNDGTFQYRIEGREAVRINGFGKVRYQEGIGDSYLISSDSVFCKPNGFYTGLGFAISFDKAPGSQIHEARWGVIEKGFFGNSGDLESNIYEHCDGSTGKLHITKETETFIEGYYEAEYFELIGQNGQDCASWQSAGLIRVDFAVPLERCPASPYIDKGAFLYYFQGTPPVNQYKEGFARLVPDDNFYIVASDSIQCTADGTYSTAAQRDTGFVITFFKTPQNDFVSRTGVLRRVINGDTLVVYSGDFLRNCNTAPPVVTILRETDYYLEGKYEANFFELIGQNPNDCASWRSVGVLTAEFAVPLEICN